MFKTPSHLSEVARIAVANELNARVVDTLDLQSQLKVAHWNVRGPHFAALHQLFETLATSAAAQTDELAERAIVLGAYVAATTRAAAKASSLPELPQASKDLELAALLADRFDVLLAGLRASRKVAEQHGDTDTVDLLTGMITSNEKHAWFLRATVA